MKEIEKEKEKSIIQKERLIKDVEGFMMKKYTQMEMVNDLENLCKGKLILALRNKAQVVAQGMRLHERLEIFENKRPDVLMFGTNTIASISEEEKERMKTQKEISIQQTKEYETMKDVLIKQKSLLQAMKIDMKKIQIQLEVAFLMD